MSGVHIGFVIESGFARSDVVNLKTVSRQGVGAPQELVYDVTEKHGVVLAERNLDSKPALHTLYTCFGPCLDATQIVFYGCYPVIEIPYRKDPQIGSG